MGILEKLGFKKQLNIDEQIAETKRQIAHREQLLKEPLGLSGEAKTSRDAGIWGREIQGLQDKLALLWEKKRREEEKTVEQLKQ